MKKYLLILILILSFLIRIYRLSIPEKYYFDEVYHAVTAKLYSRNDPKAYEWWHPAPEPDTAIEWLHPPIAKLTQAVGIKIFGENSFGWRISSVVFGVGVIYLTYLLTLQLFTSNTIALLSAFLVSLDGLLFAQSRIAMNDIHVTFFILLSLLWYLSWHKTPTNRMFLLFSGIAAGLAISTKWSGAFVIGIFFVDTAIRLLHKRTFPAFSTIFRIAVAWILIPINIYILSFSQFWLQGHTIAQFKELHNQIWYYQTHLKATHPFQSRPLQWILDARPVWTFADFSKPNHAINIYNIGNPVIFLGGLISMLYIGTKIFKKKTAQQTTSAFRFLCIAYLFLWIFWVFSPRIMFFYHYAPAVPLLSTALAYAIYTTMLKDTQTNIVGTGIILVALIWFIVFYPNLSAFPVPKSFAESVYFLIPSWR